LATKASRQRSLEGYQPTISTNLELFLECCKELLALRSFYNYSGEYCHHAAIPRKVEGSLDVDTVKE
jgi:hypothetical protein